MESSSADGPPFDPDLAAALPALHEILPPRLTAAEIPRARATMRWVSKSLDHVIGARPLVHTDRAADGVPVTVVRPAAAGSGRPVLVYLHGGGMIMGDRFVGAHEYCAWAEELDAVVVTVDYRLAPEHPFPAGLDDCLTAVRWTHRHAVELGVDPARLVLAGTSAGGGLAAGTALRLRDEGGSRPAGQLLCAPMLDDRMETVSARQFATGGMWDHVSNRTGWDALLGPARGGPGVAAHAAPARAADLADLPPAFVDVGTAETFRDEAVGYASALWRAGVPAELHVWSGAFHGSDSFVPRAALSVQARRARVDWLRRVLGAG
ncbi:alpha/beta hydrolase fold domain-containing protein [Pseudonocardia sp. ICBG1122]|nr:alpha/beta hydrolase fold domain-containing protein [Pseudonocardia pini]